MPNELFRYVTRVALLALVATVATPAPAQPDPADSPEEASARGSQEPARDPSRRAARQETPADEAPEIFVPSEEISGDTVVPFPVDI